VELFEAQETEYRAGVLPHGVPKVVVEAGVSRPWRAVVGAHALVLGLDDFGASAPAEVLSEKLGFTPETVATKVRAWLSVRRATP
jgi:transketolase